MHPYHMINDNVQIQVDTIPQADHIQTQVETIPEVESIETQVDTDPSQAKGEMSASERTISSKLNCIVALLTTLIVLCAGAVVVSFTQEEAEPIIYYFQGASSSDVKNNERLADHIQQLQQHSGGHEWKCGNNTLDILIDGNSVKLGPKWFSPREIEQLKTLNGCSDITTFEIF